MCICISLRADTPICMQRGLRLLRLSLLAALLGSLLLLQLLVGQCSETAGDLLDLIARQVFAYGLRELLHEQCVVRPLAVGGEKRGQRLPQLCELVLGGRVEDG